MTRGCGKMAVVLQMWMYYLFYIYIEKKVLGKQSLLCTHFLCKCVCAQVMHTAMWNMGISSIPKWLLSLACRSVMYEKRLKKHTHTHTVPTHTHALFLHHWSLIITNNITKCQCKQIIAHGCMHRDAMFMGHLKPIKKQKDSTLMLTRCSYVCVHLKPDNGSAHCNTYATHCNSSFFTSNKNRIFPWYLTHPKQHAQHGSPTQLSHQLQGTTWMPSFEAQDDSNSPRGKGQHSKLFCFHTVST